MVWMDVNTLDLRLDLPKETLEEGFKEELEVWGQGEVKVQGVTLIWDRVIETPVVVEAKDLVTVCEDALESPMCSYDTIQALRKQAKGALDDAGK